MNIGQASAGSGVPAKMIRYYERIGLIAVPERSRSGYRTYAESDVAALRFIRQARDLGFPLARIRELLALWQDRSRSSKEVKRIALATAGELRLKLAELQRMAGALEHLAAHCNGDERPECPIIDRLAGARPAFEGGPPALGEAAEGGSRRGACPTPATRRGERDRTDAGWR